MNDYIKDANQDEQKFIIKRSGKQVPFELVKIKAAITKANSEEKRTDNKLTDAQIDEITEIVESIVFHTERALSVEEIQDIVQHEICKRSYSVFLLYHDYRASRQETRNKTGLFAKIEGIVDVTKNEDGSVSVQNEEVRQENSNKNPTVVSVQRDYMAGEISREYTTKFLLPPEISRAHEEGIIHFHDSDYFANREHNCDLVNLDDMLQNGTCISGTKIDRPKSFATACTVASQIVAQVASSQYGGQTITLSHLAPFVDVSRQRISKRLHEEFEEAGITATEDKMKKLIEDEVRKEVESGCQTIQYQLITLQSTNGQAPFVTVFMYLDEVPDGQIREDLALIIEAILRQRILGVKDRKGYYVTPAFPKLIYALDEDNMPEDSKYHYLTELAAQCTAKRMVPDYISAKKMRELKNGDVYPCMGCRSFLTPDRFTDAGVGNIADATNYKPAVHKYYGRFNQGVVTVNLVDAACSSGGDEDKFWAIMNERLELCHSALQIRHNRLMGTPSDVAPILWQDGALARLKPGDVIDPLLFDGYSTISLGYAGLAECVYYMKGVSHTSEEGKSFGLKVMQMLNDYCMKWKKAENIDYSVYGTPLESTTYKFAKCLQRRFGIIPHVTDKNYITNSYHIHVSEEIDAFDKLSKEAEFQKLSPGGAISYVEVPDMENNIPAVLTIMKHIYDTILYAELNTKSDLCDVCGYTGEIKIVKDNHGKLVWECPNCGNRDQTKMHVARRTCGYIGTQYWNQGRTAEIQDRVEHVSCGTIPQA